jgi:CTP synthase (UTP-ammonia lyase)
VGKSERIELLKDTLAYRVYKRGIIEEKYSCSYSLNPEYQKKFKESRLKIVGRNEEGATRVIEIEEQGFFMASLFLPQMNSTAEKPHPMVLKFLEEALIFRQLKEGVALKRRSNKNTTGVKKL